MTLFIILTVLTTILLMVKKYGEKASKPIATIIVLGLVLLAIVGANT